MVRAVERAAAIGADVMQVFSDNPTAWRRRSKLPHELPVFRRRLRELGIGPLAIHASYLVNLAGPDPEFHDRSVGVLARELLTGRAYGARFVNVHIGSHRGSGRDAGIERTADTVAQAIAAAEDAFGHDGGLDATVDDGVDDGHDGVHDPPDGEHDDHEPAADRTINDPSSDEWPILSLENSAGGGFGLGATVEELAEVLGAIERRGVPAGRIGITLDTAHLWAAGLRINEPDELETMLDAFEREIGLRRLAMIHLNNSKSELGSHTDRHQHIGAGQIGEAGMAAILCHPRLLHAPCYLETPGMDDGYDAVNLDRCRGLMGGRPLAQLSAEALDMPGSRSRTAPPDPDDPDAAPAEGSRGRRHRGSESEEATISGPSGTARAPGDQ